MKSCFARQIQLSTYCSDDQDCLKSPDHLLISAIDIRVRVLLVIFMSKILSFIAHSFLYMTGKAGSYETSQSVARDQTLTWIIARPTLHKCALVITGPFESQSEKEFWNSQQKVTLKYWI